MLCVNEVDCDNDIPFVSNNNYVNTLTATWYTGGTKVLLP